MSLAEFHLDSVGHTVHEVADALSHSASALLRTLAAVPPFPHTFSVKGYIYVYVTPVQIPFLPFYQKQFAYKVKVAL